jgi:hypothetical protein
MERSRQHKKKKKKKSPFHAPSAGIKFQQETGRFISLFVNGVILMQMSHKKMRLILQATVLKKRATLLPLHINRKTLQTCLSHDSNTQKHRPNSTVVAATTKPIHPLISGNVVDVPY